MIGEASVLYRIRFCPFCGRYLGELESEELNYCPFCGAWLMWLKRRLRLRLPTRRKIFYGGSLEGDGDER